MPSKAKKPNPNPICMYDWLCAHDVVEWLRPLWEDGGWYLGADGRLRIKTKAMVIDTPWVHHGHNEHNHCGLWSHVLFNVVSQRMRRLFADGTPFVPSPCQDCYKVVVRPQTLIQLFALDELQEQLDRPSKCGIELRESVMGLYGGYFYHRGLPAGREGYDLIRQEVDRTTHLGQKVPVILKRGCTEMEHLVGPSNLWTVTEEQRIIEEYVNEFIDWDRQEVDQPKWLVYNIKRKWIEWAFQNGDETYKAFTGGKSIKPGYITYHEGQEEPKRPKKLADKPIDVYHARTPAAKSDQLDRCPGDTLVGPKI